MSVVFQWIHLTAAVVGVGGIAFLTFILLPSSSVVSAEQRDQLLKAVLGRFRWVSWSVILLLIVSGLYNVTLVWEVPWGTYWKFLTLKILLAIAVFTISLTLTLPLKFLERFRANREFWLTVALGLALLVILISAFLRGRVSA